MMMINLHENYVATLGFKLVTPGTAVRHATDHAINHVMKDQSEFIPVMNCMRAFFTTTVQDQ